MTTSAKPSEADARAMIDNQLREKGWAPGQISREVPRNADEKRMLGRGRPDYMLYLGGETRVFAVIEAKRRSGNLADALEQGAAYARKLKCPIVIASDGEVLRTRHMADGEALRINHEEMRELPSEKTLRMFRGESLWVRGEVARNTRELISIFKKAGKHLLRAGLANIEAFSEFSQILFFKVVSEISDEEESRDPPPVHWRDIENLQGRALLRKYNEGARLLGEKYPGVFGETRIANPDILRDIVVKLRGYSFIDVDSDVKGEAYEYFLRRYNQQKNELAQYFTPRHVVRAMVGLTNPRFGEKIYDPFCGTGGMLIQAFKHMRLNAPGAETPRERERNERVLRNESVFGGDISRSAQTAKMNMILAGDGHSNIHHGDSLEREADGQYDAVITNIPFSADEISCLRHCMAAVAGRPGGRFCAIVPERVLDSDKDDYAALRAELAREWTIRRVVSLPREVFRGFTSAKTSIIFAEWGDGRGGRKAAAKRQIVPYFTVENDGFTPDARRSPLPGASDLDRLLEDRHEGRACENISSAAPLWELKPEAKLDVASGFPLRPLRELVEVRERKITITPEMTCREPGFDGKTHSVYLREEQHGYNVGVTRRRKILPGDLVFAKMHLQDGLFGFADAEYHSAGTQLICVVRESEMDRDFLFWALDWVVPKLSLVDTTGRENYSDDDILNLPIPCPPMATQKKLARELRKAAEAETRARESRQAGQKKFGRILERGA